MRHLGEPHPGLAWSGQALVARHVVESPDQWPAQLGAAEGASRMDCTVQYAESLFLLPLLACLFQSRCNGPRASRLLTPLCFTRSWLYLPPSSSGLEGFRLDQHPSAAPCCPISQLISAASSVACCLLPKFRRGSLQLHLSDCAAPHLG